MCINTKVRTYTNFEIHGENSNGKDNIETTLHFGLNKTKRNLNSLWMQMMECFSYHKPNYCKLSSFIQSVLPKLITSIHLFLWKQRRIKAGFILSNLMRIKKSIWGMCKNSIECSMILIINTLQWLLRLGKFNKLVK